MKLRNQLSALFIIVLTLFVFSNISMAASDITGWDKVKWGDSVSKVKKLYGPLKRVFQKKDVSIYQSSNNITITKIPFRPTFFFLKENGLIRVDLRPYKKQKRGEVTRLNTNNGCDYCFDQILGLLKSKYGKPIHSTKGASTALSWTQPSGKAILSFTDFKDSKTGSVNHHIDAIFYIRILGGSKL